MSWAEHGEHMHIKELGLPEKVKNALWRKGITSLDELLEMSDQEILALGNIGKVGLGMLKAVLVKHGCMNVERCKCCGQVTRSAQHGVHWTGSASPSDNDSAQPASQ